jgi:hypothetical protein
MIFDIIGDVHGHASHLTKLLKIIGYKNRKGSFKHPERKAIFVGDFINRGPEIKNTIRIIRSMVEDGNALAILGNHELNALIYQLKDKNGKRLVKSSDKYFMSLLKTLNEFKGEKQEWKSHLKWMRTLPLYIDNKGFRVIHACWSGNAIKNINTIHEEGKIRKKTLKKIQLEQKGELAKSIWTLTKGVSLKLPRDLRIKTNKGNSPRSFRVKWWEKERNLTFRDFSFESKYKMPNYSIPSEIIPEIYPYRKREVPLFFGHYCKGSGPYIIKSNLCCVDSCVVNTKILTAYSWEGENKLLNEHLIQVSL